MPHSNHESDDEEVDDNDTYVGLYETYVPDDTRSLNSRDQEIFDGYLGLFKESLQNTPSFDDDENLKQQSKRHPWQAWALNLKPLINKMVLDAFKSPDIERGGEIGRVEGVELYLTGSLAKSQATPYSDFDAFVLYRDDDTKQKAHPVFVAVNHLLFRIFEKANVLCPDPIGLNPQRLGDTPEKLAEKVQDGMVPELETLIAVMSSKPLMGSGDLQQELRDIVESRSELKEKITAKSIYQNALSFKPPESGAETINIKTHILRPLDFMLMGLRSEFPEYFIDNEDGKYLDTLRTIDRLILLVSRGHNDDRPIDPRLPSFDVLCALQETFIGAMTLRFHQHVAHKKEVDTVAIQSHDDIPKLLNNVECLRGYFNSRLIQLDASLTGHETLEKTYANDYQKQRVTRRKRNALLGSSLTLLSVGIGVLLVATGVFAPLGVGLVGFSAMAGAGFLAGAMMAAVSIFTHNKSAPIKRKQFTSPHMRQGERITIHHPRPASLRSDSTSLLVRRLGEPRGPVEETMHVHDRDESIVHERTRAAEEEQEFNQPNRVEQEYIDMSMSSS